MRQLGTDPRPGAPLAESPVPGPLGILQWVYVGRIVVSLVVFLAAAFYFAAVPPGVLARNPNAPPAVHRGCRGAGVCAELSGTKAERNIMVPVSKSPVRTIVFNLTVI